MTVSDLIVARKWIKDLLRNDAQRLGDALNLDGRNEVAAAWRRAEQAVDDMYIIALSLEECPKPKVMCTEDTPCEFHNPDGTLKRG